MLKYIEKEFISTDIDHTKEWMTDLIVNGFNWSLYDSFANELIFTTSGEDAKQIPIFLYIGVGSATDIYVSLYAYWDASAHTGVYFPSTDPINRKFIMRSGFTHAVGNKDRIFISSFLASTHNYDKYYINLYAGYLPIILNDVRSKMTSMTAAGMSATVEVEDTSKFVVGQSYQIVGINGEGCDWPIIPTNIIDSTHMTINEMPRDYAAGALIGVFPCPAFSSTQNYNSRSFQLRMLFPRRSIGTTGLNSDYSEPSFPKTSYTDPSFPANRYILSPLLYWEHDGPEADGKFFALDTEFLSTTMLGGHILGISNDADMIKGTVTTVPDNISITCDTLSLTDNILIDKFVVFDSGTGHWQIRQILSNTSDTIVVTARWETTPDNTTTFFVCDEAYRSENISNGYCPFYIPITNFTFMEDSY